MKKVLVLKAGEAANAVRLSVGDYERWFQLALAAEAKLEVLKVSQGAKPPRSLQGYDALIMTGSPLSVTSPTDWMIRSAELLKKAGDRGLPVLGVCFGHQLLGFAYGSKVILNPKGREIGSIQVELTPEGRTDPLFTNLPQVFWTQTTHEDIVSSLPKGARHLAFNPQTPIQAFGIGRNVRAVQFHPEMEPEMIGALVRARAQILEREGSRRGRGRGEWTGELLSGIRRTRAGKRILLNFLRYFD